MIINLEHFCIFYFEENEEESEDIEALEQESQMAKDILHKAIDNTKIAENVYPNLKEELHKAVDMRGEK